MAPGLVVQKASGTGRPLHRTPGWPLSHPSSGKTVTTQLLANGTHTILLNPVGAYVGNVTVAVR